MKIIRVVAAVIQRKHNGSKQIFATQRGYGEFEGGWVDGSSQAEKLKSVKLRRRH